MKESEKVCVVSPISREREREKREARGSPLGKQRRLHAGIPPLVFFFLSLPSSSSVLYILLALVL